MQVIEAQCTWSWRLTITLHINHERMVDRPGPADVLDAPNACLSVALAT